MSHCLPPKQHCAACRAEVRAAQMTEREWRRALWFHERMSPRAAWVALAFGGAFVARIVVTEQAKQPLMPWFPLLAFLATIAAVALLLSYHWRPREWTYDEANGPHLGEEVDSYRAAKVAREWHEEIGWDADVAVLKAREEALGEVYQLEERIKRRTREIKGR